MYNCLGYCTDLPFQPNSKISQPDILEFIVEDPYLEICDEKTIDPRDPCMGVPPPLPKPRPKPLEPVFCSLGKLQPSPLLLPTPSPSLPPLEVPKVLLELDEDPCKQYEGDCGRCFLYD